MVSALVFSLVFAHKCGLAFPHLPSCPKWLVLLCFLASSILHIFHPPTDSNINWYNQCKQRKRKEWSIVWVHLHGLSGSDRKCFSKEWIRKSHLSANFHRKKKIEMHTWAVESECCFERFALVFDSFAGWLINFCLTFQNQPATNYQYVFHATSVATFVYFLHDITA